MAKATTTIGQTLNHEPEHGAWFAANQALFNQVTASYFSVIQAHELVLELGNQEALTALEQLTHKTKKNPNPIMPLAERAEDVPAMFRRAAIHAALGSARPFYALLKSWRAIQGACVAVLVQPGEPVPSTSAALDLEPFIRRRKREVNLQRALAAVAGYISTIEAWRPVLDGGGSDLAIEPDISDTFHIVFENVTGYLDKKERDFRQLVHKKRVLYRLETLAA